MGVPKFFRYTSERYPCLNELVKQYQIPDFDNMYLDMNGIIHNCSHPDDSNPHFRITEKKIFEDIFHYLTILFQIIKPKKLFFMAIDGVAPRAKMNQQRGRRFRSAREAEKLEEEARNKGETLPTEKRFDSNCITPGTVFMARLHEQLRYFVKSKISTDPLWAKVKVILSGHETPGEGEHKIMDYIRWSRSQPDYDPNTRHCLYGLDADLIMLGMCTHEPHFALLREEVKFGKSTNRTTSPEETNFYLLHLSLLREYLEQEFISIKDGLPFQYDLEKIVDDWVLMGFLVGNDFIPNLPNMHISNDALPVLYNTYMKVLPTLDGYINEAGDLNLRRFEVFMQELAKIDMEKFQDTYADLKYFEAKTGRRPNANERRDYKPNNDETFNVNVDDIKANKPDDELQALINATEDMFMDDMEIENDDDEYEETSDEEANMAMEFILHKKDYYMNKLDYSKVTDEVLADQAEGYVRAIQWNLYYYYKGCPSWCWYYPHHYAPYISDIKGFADLKIEFELGEPFKPFEQLLAVLPAASKQLLPAPFHALMTDEDSPIVHYYPINFETDLNGKRNDWEAVVLIPFIDEVNLLSAMEPCYQRLTEEEKSRNTHGPMLVYNWTQQNLGVMPAPQHFDPIAECHATETKVWRQELEVPGSMLKRGMLPNAMRDMLFPGFPTMRHLKYQTSIKKGKVKVFDQPSRNENMIVEIIRESETEDPITEVAKKMLGKVIWAGWPHLTRAKVISVSNEKLRLHHIDQQNNNTDGSPHYSTEPNSGNLQRQWISERSTIIEHNMNRLGIELGEVTTVIHAVNLKGFKYMVQDNVKMVQEPEWCAVPCGYALQAVVPDVSAHIIHEGGRFSTLQEAYPNGDSVFLLTPGPHYGAHATIVESESIRNGRIKVSVVERPEPVPRQQSSAMPYRTANHAAAACGVSAQILSRITGTILMVPGVRHDNPTEQANKINIGLNLKFNKKNLEVAGYTRRCKVTNSWLYSERCIKLVQEYETLFPEVFDCLGSGKQSKDVYFESDIFPQDMGKKKAEDIAKWIKDQPHVRAARRECGSEALEPEDMRALADDLDRQLETLKGMEKKHTIQVKWNLLYKAELHSGNLCPDRAADFKLYDRVVCVAPHLTAPRAATGTVVAVCPTGPCNTVRLSDKLNTDPSYLVMFDKPFPGAMTEDLFEEARFYRMTPNNMLNLSYGRKLRNAAPPAVPQDSFIPQRPQNQPTPNVLRREDGHHSAFANYSPPGDKAVSPDSRNHNASVASNGSPSGNSATDLLKSLLKISEDPEVKKNKETPTPEQNRNWRAKNDNAQPTAVYTQQSTPPVFWSLFSGGPPPPQNWRKENASHGNNNRQQPVFSNYKNQAPAFPPFPTFGQPYPGPVPNQIPFPQFQNPHFQQRNQPYNMPRNQGTHNRSFETPPNRSFESHNRSLEPTNNRGFEPPQNFPKHLPSVGTVGPNITLGPSWHQPSNPANAQNPRSPNANRPPPQSSNDKVSNPFVPLQVQTRRVSHPGGSSSKQDLGQSSSQKSTLPKPQPTTAPINQQNQGQTAKPSKKKKKPRIAANLPFQMD
ncbi:5'-3' exoribonuclease 1 isoform X1 [Spodoptera frugiperda]|uniref:5'-3' exoribonuclease 1 n=2 Tax=Spodoptera frugiperda TaxID=7108 RepID=A0A9R0F1X0_SPOFR|nr:5'-3' exoribonuclease 1 isoform X1 [Spodoptera frugiperda]